MEGECPVCSAHVPVPSDAVIGELISCAECASELEVKTLEPIALEEAPQEEEDWGQ